MFYLFEYSFNAFFVLILKIILYLHLRVTKDIQVHLFVYRNFCILVLHLNQFIK